MRGIRRTLQVISAVALLWAATVALTGGFAFAIFSVRVSSRNPINPGLVALASALASLALAWPAMGRTVAADAHWFWKTLTRATVRLSPAVIVALAGLGMRACAWAAARPLWLDEQMIALNVKGRSLLDLDGPLWLGQASPLGWLATERIAAVTFGTGEQALRLLPAVWGAATIVSAALIGKRWMTPFGAAILVLLCSVGQTIALYSTELKPYSADTFWGLLLPVAAAWAVAEPSLSPGGLARRSALWWTLAALGQWFSYGALLVTLPCATVAFGVMIRRRDWRPARTFALFALVWVASFGLHYALSMRYTLGSEYLRRYWAFAMPPTSAGFAETLRWLASRLQPIADRPGGTDFGVLFWLAIVMGLLVARHRILATTLATVILSGFALAAFRQVPLYERLSLWMLPSLYVSLALLSDHAVYLARTARATGRVRPALLAVIVCVPVVWVGSDVVARGKNEFLVTAMSDSNHGLDDRGAVRWLLDRHRTGEAIVTTHLALPALWWYGGVPLDEGVFDGGRLPDGSPILEASYVSTRGCPPGELREHLDGRSRAFLYFGFRFDDVPKGFDRLLLGEAAAVGEPALVADFGSVGHVAVFDVNSSIGPARVPVTLWMGDADPAPDGCVAVRGAARW